MLGWRSGAWIACAGVAGCSLAIDAALPDGTSSSSSASATSSSVGAGGGQGGQGGGTTSTSSSGAGGMASCPANGTSNLKDAFDDNSLGPEWLLEEDSGAQITDVMGEARIALPGTSFSFGYLKSAAAFDLAGCHVSVKVVELPKANSGGYGGLLLRSFSDDTIDLEMLGDQSAIDLRWRSGATKVDIATVPYVAGQDVYFRIREAAGTVHFETSKDGISFTERGSVATPFPVASMRIGVAAGNNGSQGSVGSARFDDFGILP